MRIRRRTGILTAGLLLGGVGAAPAQEATGPPRPVSPYHPHPATAVPPAPPAQESWLPEPSAGGPALPAPPAAAGCHGSRSFKGGWKAKVQDCFLGRPEAFDAPPLGQSVALHYRTHVANAVAARMTLYDYDFVGGTEQLNYRGKDRLRQIAAALSHNAAPIVIERLPFAPALAEARRMAVLNELAAVAAVPPERVVVGPPLAVPLHGVEAETIYQNLLRSTETNGVWVSQGLETGARPEVGDVRTGQGGAGATGGPTVTGPGAAPR